MKCLLQPLKEDSEELKMIKKYIESTHAPTHKTFTLEVESVFKLDREGMCMCMGGKWASGQMGSVHTVEKARSFLPSFLQQLISSCITFLFFSLNILFFFSYYLLL